MNITRPALERWFEDHQAGARFDLGGTMVPADLERLRAVLPVNTFDGRYPPSVGSAEARHLLAQSEGLDPAHLVLCCGATEAGTAALLAAARPGSAAVLQDPLYYLFAPWLTALGLELRRWGARDDGAWHASDLEGLLDAQVSVVVVNSPHNPTGWTMDLTPIARQIESLPDAWLLVDEVYRQVSADDLPCGATLSERVIATSSLAKRWGLPGLRLGWLACRDAQLRERALAWHEHLAHSPPRSSETALVALWPELQIQLAAAQAIASRNAGLVQSWLARHAGSFEGSLPQAGVTTLVRPAGCADDVAFALAARRHDVFVVPGAFLGYPGHLRIGFGHRDPDDLLEGLDRLAQIQQEAPSLSPRQA